MIQQWRQVNNHKLCFFTNVLQKLHRNAILCLPGLGQTKAGSYFLYSQITRRFSNNWDTYQVDYWGFGDSEGEIEECEYYDILLDCSTILKDLCGMYTQVVVISSGFANSIACNMGKYFINTQIFLLEPESEYSKFDDVLSCIMRYQQNHIKHIDTSELYEQCPSAEEIFWILGEGYNRCKGLFLRISFLRDMIEQYRIDLDNPRVCIFSNKENEKHSDYTISAHHISLSPIAREELLHIIERELMNRVE